MKNKIKLLVILIWLVACIFLGKNRLAVFYYDRGNNHYDRNLYKEAEGYFIKSLKINPSVALVHYSLANTYIKEKLEDKALEEYKIAVRLDRRFVLGYELLAHIYLAHRNYQEAISQLREAEVILPESQEIKDLISFASSEYVVDLLNAGVEALTRGDRLRAYELLSKALKINPDFVFTRYLLGYFYYNEKNYDKAEAMLNKVVILDNNFFLAYKLLGDIYFEKRIFNKAIDKYKTALAINKNDAVILSNIGLAYMNLENYNEAISFLKDALGINPGNLNVRYSLASVYRDSGKLSRAVPEYINVINAQPDYPNVHNDLGDIYKQQGKTKEAIEEYRKEIYSSQNKLLNNPNDAFVLADIAHAYNGIGEYNKAKELIDKALNIKPDYQQGYLTLASIYRNLGNSTDALAALEKAKGLSAQKYFFIEKAIKDVKEVNELKDFIKEKEEFRPVDIVYLKNGRRIAGIIKKETEDGIVLEIKAGSAIGTVTLSRDSIERIASEKINNK